MPPTTPALRTHLRRLRDQVSRLAVREGRTDSACPGLRFYRFSAPVTYRKTQVLVPGLVVVLQGTKEIRLADETLRYEAAQCLVLGGETVCRGTVVTASAGAPYLALHLDLPPEVLLKALATMADLAPGTEAPAPCETFVTAVDTGILACMDRLLAACTTELDRRSIAPLVVEEIVLRLLRLDAARALRRVSVVSRAAARIQQSMRHIRERFHEALTVEDLARHACMSPSHYAHLFREVAGVSPMRFLRDARLDAARELLLAGGVRAGVVAAQVGFESSAHFSREFKNRFDAAPIEYVRRLREGSSRGQ